MSFLKRAIKRGISEGVGRAVGEAITKAVEPKATELANKAAEQLDKHTQKQQQTMKNPFMGLESSFSNLEKAVQGYATEMSKNVKVCPACQQPTTSDKKFCPNCGEKLPEETLAQGAVCSNCGKQNDIGTKFCQECGTKLPYVIQEEMAAAEKDLAVMKQWDECLSQYPKWNCGGKNFEITFLDGSILFSADFNENNYEARNAVETYKEILNQDGYRPAGQYPSDVQLYKMIEGKCYHVDVEHCFDGDGDCPCIYFTIGEPIGGFNYVKPEPKKKIGFKDILKF